MMVIYATCSPEYAVNMGLDVFTGEFYVRVNSGGKFKIFHYKTHDEALGAYSYELKKLTLQWPTGDGDYKPK
jgi:hypothetical protein